MLIGLDTETFYDTKAGLDIKTMGGWHYTRACPAYLVALYCPEWSYVGAAEDAPWERIRGCTIAAHNAAFDEQVIKALQEKGIIPADLKLDFVCSADLASYLGAPRALQGAAELLLGKAVSKDTRSYMDGKQWADAVAAGKAEELKFYCLNDALLTYEIAARYLPQWPEKEQRVSKLTREAAYTGVHINVSALEEGLAKLQQVMMEAASQIPWSKDDKILSPKALKKHCKLAGIEPPSSLAESNEQCAAWEEEHDNIPWVRAMRNWRKANTLLTKLRVLQSRIRPDGTAGVNSLKYFGAGTGRFSGEGEKFNIQNLHREAIFGVDIRSLIIPPPGHKFIIADFAQIEPRVLACLVGNKALLERVKDGGKSLYQAHAELTMGWNPEKDLKKEDPMLYRQSKAAVLGLGYGCGAARFSSMARSLAGLKITESEAEKIVQHFRDTNPLITRYWRDLSQRFKFNRGKDFLLELPSGRTIRYRNVNPHGEWTAQLQSRTMKIYGGLLCENCTQATARDILADAILRLDEAGYKTLFSVHDEVIIAVPEEQAEEALQDIRRLMCIPPDWMPDIPLEVSAEIADCYRK